MGIECCHKAKGGPQNEIVDTENEHPVKYTDDFTEGVTARKVMKFSSHTLSSMMIIKSRLSLSRSTNLHFLKHQDLKSFRDYEKEESEKKKAMLPLMNKNSLGLQKIGTLMEKVEEEKSLRCNSQKELETWRKEDHIKIDLANFRNEEQPSQLDRYEAVGVLGKGFSGVVHKVQDKKTHSYKAMKIIPKKPSSSQVSEKEDSEVKEEISILKKVDHPNVLRFYKFFQDTQNYYLITEFCAGGDLISKLCSLQNIDERHVVGLFSQLLSAIAYCHSLNIIHRDLKPENILLNGSKLEDGIKIIDFGRSRILRPNEKLRELAGSLYYTAPEIIAKKEYDGACDLWSCGVILHLLLSGTLPFNGRSKEEIIRAIQSRELSLSGIAWESVSDMAKNLLREMLRRDSASRITASAALSHPWFHRFTTPSLSGHIKHCIPCLRKLRGFRVQNVLQKSVLSYLASQFLNPKREKKLRNIFHILDTNGDGKLSEDEIYEGMKVLSPKTARKDSRRLLIEADINQNGALDFTEFIMANMTPEELRNEFELKQAFDFYDENKNGSISLEELKKIFGKLCGDEELKEIIREVDLDGNNEISFEEFSSMMAGLRNIIKLLEKEGVTLQSFSELTLFSDI